MPYRTIYANKSDLKRHRDADCTHRPLIQTTGDPIKCSERIASCPTVSLQPRLSTVHFWDGLTAELDLAEIERSAMSVKGSTCPYPLRFLDIYANLRSSQGHVLADVTGVATLTSSDQLQRESDLRRHPWRTVKDYFLPKMPGTTFKLGYNIQQPPYCWRECDPRTLAVNFTYNSSAIYRILGNLANQGFVSQKMLPTLFDRACECLSLVYKARNNFVMRNMNNNFGMYLVPKIIEYLLGKTTYDSERQEEPLTNASLRASLTLVPDYASIDTLSLMAIALGKGVSFMEKHVRDERISRSNLISIQDTFHQYSGQCLTIDHREVLIDMIENLGLRKNLFTMAAILDDTAETVDDLLWMLNLLERYPFFRVEAVINTARVSVNFSLDMLPAVLNSPVFRGLAARFGRQFKVIKTYYPLFALQSNFLTKTVREAIQRADVVYVKGANYFETLQLKEKDVFYAFVVHGPICTKYTGLKEYDSVFAYVPAGKAGYVHGKGTSRLRRLVDTLEEGTRSGVCRNSGR